MPVTWMIHFVKTPSSFPCLPATLLQQQRSFYVSFVFDCPLMKTPAWRPSIGSQEDMFITLSLRLKFSSCLRLQGWFHISLQDRLLNYFPIHKGGGREDTQNLNSTVPYRVFLSFIRSVYLAFFSHCAVLFSKNICVKDFL